ncbi:MAG: HNH endonuclease [Calditrichaeota bacterium]|nr:MAG: HNH endonuclease [Calditrichota bacterium]
MAEPISAIVATVVKEAGKEVAKLKEALESGIQESPVQELLRIIEGNSLEALEIRNIETVNSHLEGKLHPETGVPFVRRVVEDFKGEFLSGVFPDFKEHTIFKLDLPERLYTERDKVQFNYCNEKLREAFSAGEIDTTSLTEKQIEQIKNGDKPEGFTWHHNEVKGRMELVKTDIHLRTGHTGGREIWGGGRVHR